MSTLAEEATLLTRTTIWKFPITEMSQEVETPKIIRCLHFATQNGVPHLWAEVEVGTPKRRYRFEVRFTGQAHPLHDAFSHVGSALVEAEGVVLHLYWDGVARDLEPKEPVGVSPPSPETEGGAEEGGERMTGYLIDVPYRGIRTYWVEAKTAEEARKKFHAGGREHVEDDEDEGEITLVEVDIAG